MATKSRGSSFQETPIKHTAGGEMPDPSDQHHVSAEEFDALGGVEGEEMSSKFMDQAKTYLPAVLGAIGIGAGIYFLAKKYQSGEWSFGRTKEISNDTTTSESQRALDIDDVPPSRLMGA